MKIFLVIPTIRNLEFLKHWKNSFSLCDIIIVEDNENKTIKIPKINSKSIFHFSREDINKDLGKDNWIIPRRNAGIRNYGFYKAYQKKADVIITLDDDCYPFDDSFVEKHIRNLEFKLPNFWVNTYPDPKYFYTRGMPYKNRNMIKVYISHGLWSGSLDLDAKTEIKLPKNLNENSKYNDLIQVIPKGYYYPMCSMNLAFRREVIPLMFFPMMGQKPDGTAWKYNRYDDIWAGIFSKKIMDHLDMAVVSGSPFVEHRKMSKSLDNIKKEAKGMGVNEFLWKKVHEVKLTKKNPKDCYIELAKKINFPKEEYFEKLRVAMIIWANLF